MWVARALDDMLFVHVWQVGIMLNDLAIHNMVIGGPAHQSKQIEVSLPLHGAQRARCAKIRDTPTNNRRSGTLS